MTTGNITAFRGINNRLPKDRLDGQKGPPFVHDAVNVDLNTAGQFQRRPGYSRVVDATNCRSMHEADDGTALYAAGTELLSFDGSSSVVIADLSSAYVDVAYAKTPIGMAWSDGSTLNLIQAGVSRLMAPAMPNPTPSAAGAAGGSLPGGTYGVMFCTRTEDGQRSPMSLPQYVAVPEGGSITISAIAHAQAIEVLMTATDGEVFYRAGSIEPGDTSVVIPIQITSGEPVIYMVKALLPAGGILAIHKGRLISVVGAMMFHSMPFEFGIYRPAVDFTPFPDAITMVASVESGVFVATATKTWFMPGGDIGVSSMVARAPFGAIPGTLSKIPDSEDVMWFSPRGPIRGLQDGSIELLQDGQIAYEESASGASMFREENGLRTFIAALSGSTPTGSAVMGSYMDAEVIN